MKKSNNLSTKAIWLAILIAANVAAACSSSGGAATDAPGLKTPTAAGAGTGLGGLGKGPSPVNLGTAGNYVILAKSAISTTGTTVITGNLGINPAAASFITGFSLVLDGTGVFATSALLSGQVFASNYTPPTPANTTTAVSDMEVAFTDAASRAADYTELATGDISGMNLGPAAYKWGTGVLISSDIQLTGGANDVWIFQIAQGLTVGTGVKIILSGGAQPKNIFWQTSGAVNMGTGSQFQGVVLSQTGITMNTGASANSRLLAQTAVTLDASTVTQPSP